MTRKRKNEHEDERQDRAGGDSAEHGKGERLQKVLAAAGVGSRRDCEELIREGRVAVDKQTVTELGTRVDPLRQEIRVDGEPLKQPKRLYYAVNKPIGVVTTSHDPSGRTRVIDLVPTEERVFAVGRLDRASEGLILVTNDGEFANRITHPRYGVEKTYLVRVAGAPDHKQLDRLKKGVHLAEGYAKAQAITVKKKHGQSTDLVIVLNEGRNREIRRILARVGHKVLTLKRIAVGPVKLANLAPGEWRRLMPPEIEALLAAAKEKRREAKGKRVQATGVKVQKAAKGEQTEDRARESGVGGRESGEKRYVQKEALLAEPLSLDDLLRDDLDEGPLGGPELGGAMAMEGGESGAAGKGGVIDYEEDFETAPPAERPPAERPQGEPRGKPGPGQPRRDKRQSGKQPSGPPQSGKPRRREAEPGGAARPARGKPPFGKKSAGKRPYGKRAARQGGDETRGERTGRGERVGRGEGRDRGEAEARPQESYGRKRGGKRVYSPPHDGRGPAGSTGGNFRFRPKAAGGKGKGGSRPATAEAGGESRGGPRPGGKPTGGKPTGGKRGGGKPAGGKGGGGKGGGKPFARKSGKTGGKPFGSKPGKKFGKPGGKRKGRR